MKRRTVRGRTCTINALNTVRWQAGAIMSYLVEERTDDVLLDGLIAMWFGGVQVEACRGRVTSRFA